MRPPHRRPYTPVLGDWEGIAEGMPISFRLVYRPKYLAVHDAPYGYEDLVLVRHGFNAEEPGCAPAYSGTSQEGSADGIVSPIAASGIFESPGFSAKGGLTGPRSAVFQREESALPIGRYGQACRRVITWHLHPAHRLPVADGEWTLKFASGETETFRVLAGGRVASGIGLPSMPPECGAPAGGVELFIAAGGSSSHEEPEYATKIEITFSGSSASGQMSFGSSPGCVASLTASLTKPARS